AAGLGTLALLLSVGGLALTAAHTAALRRGQVGTLSRQVGLAVTIAIAQMLLAIVAIGELMFVSRHDALVVSLIALFVGVVADDVVDDATRRAYIERMATHIRALSALIDDLFELSRLESGDITWSLERVSLAELVGETVDALRVQAEAKGVAVRLEVPEVLSH